nr:SH3 domain-containing protein [Eikenella glucosivorans]
MLALSATAAARVQPGVCNLPEPDEVATYLVTDGDEVVNIRAQPNTRAAVLAVCDNQGEAAILGKSGAWYRVRLVWYSPPPQAQRHEISGYVHQSQASLRRVYIVHGADGSANIRRKAGNRSGMVGRFANGTRLIEFPAKRKGDWHFVGVIGRWSVFISSYYGYVHKSQIRPETGQ